MNTQRTFLSPAKDLGSAKEGTAHFWSQRLTAFAMIPLVLWLCFSLAALPGMDYSAIREWLSRPFSAVLMILLIITGLYHAKLGLQVVIEDYISNHSIRIAAIVAVTMFCALFCVLGVFSVIRIALGT